MTQIKLKHVNSFQNRRRPDKAKRFYFRVRGRKPIRLPGQPGSDEFMQAYAMAPASLQVARQDGLANITEAVAKAAEKLAKPGTIAALLPGYYRSAEWLNLGTDTKEARERII